MSYDLLGWFDGSCTPTNPGGFGGWGIVLKNGHEEVLHQGHGCLGNGPMMSNNVAEYCAVANLLEKVGTVACSGWSVMIRGDSNMVIQQLSGAWKAKQGRYMQEYLRAVAALAALENAAIWVEFEWIPREENTEADSLSTMATPASPATASAPVPQSS